MTRLLYVSADPGVPILGHKGASVHVRALAEALDALGHEVTIASPRIEAAENRLPASIRLVELPAVIPKTAADERALAADAARLAAACVELAGDLQPDLVYERYALASYAGASVREALGVPLVVEANAPLRLEAARFRTLRYEGFARTAERRLFDAADALFAVSRALADWLIGEGTPAEKVTVIPNARPIRGFAARAAPRDEGDLVIGFAGGMKLWHGVDVLLDAFRRALDGGARMRLVAVGSGPADVLLENARFPAERFIWQGHVPHAHALDLLEDWDIGVAPFKRVEGFWFSPLKLYEYMAAGLCPVVSDVGDLPDLVAGGEAGVVVPPEDASALAAALLELDADRGRVWELGQRARELALAGPTWEDTARRVVAFARTETRA